MKIHFDIKKILQTFGYGERMHPARDWFILLASALMLVIASVAWNIFLLTKVERGEAIGDEMPQTTFEAAPIDKVQEVFESRKEEELRYRQQYRFVDPSLPGG